jgi:hypothetical protein
MRCNASAWTCVGMPYWRTPSAILRWKSGSGVSGEQHRAKRVEVVGASIGRGTDRMHVPGRWAALSVIASGRYGGACAVTRGIGWYFYLVGSGSAVRARRAEVLGTLPASGVEIFAWS